jgi:glucosamine--fructose-6-phosphate aminotransferase (isomerizing)
MLKEIYEQPAAIADTLAGRLSEDGAVDLSDTGLGDDLLRRLRRIYIVACGTSYHAGLIASYALEQLARVPVQIEVASEFRYKDPVLDPDTLVIGITQSGETLDTLVAMRLSRAAGAPVMALTNIMGSQATRDADAVLFTRAGLEIGVAATKTHTAQVAALLLFALHLAEVRGGGAAGTAGTDMGGAGGGTRASEASAGGRPEPAELLRIGRELRRAPDLVQAYLDNHRRLDQIAERYHDQRFFLYLGRHVGYGVCLEGALKLKEISYIPTEAYAAGEMKHGPIALLDEGSPVVVVATDGPVYAKVVSNIEEVRARKADVIAVASEGNTDVDELAAAVLHVPKCDPWVSPLVAVVPLQLLAYRIARLTGCDVDQPRNLAKTVTVE